MNILNIFKFSGFLALHLVEVDTDPVPGLNRQALDADPDPPKMMPIRPDPDLDPQRWIYPSDIVLDKKVFPSAPYMMFSFLKVYFKFRRIIFSIVPVTSCWTGTYITALFV
jgi:hypothetical protein